MDIKCHENGVFLRLKKETIKRHIISLINGQKKITKKKIGNVNLPGVFVHFLAFSFSSMQKSHWDKKLYYVSRGVAQNGFMGVRNLTLPLFCSANT